MLALLASPLLGPAVWQPVGEQLVKRGWEVITPPAPRVAPRTPHEVLRSWLEALPTDRDLVAIAHSNAGLYVPALTIDRDVIGFAFVDAAMPTSSSDTAMAPPLLLDLLEAKADDEGMLPPWTQWWPDADVMALFPDMAVRRKVEREQHRLPLSYFRQSLPVPSGWDHRPGAYLAFGDTYDTERQAAAGRGWPVVTLSGGHLHMLTDPALVARHVHALLTAMSLDPPGTSDTPIDSTGHSVTS